MSQQPLADDDFTRLTAFLDSIGDAAMNIEMLDRYFYALICGPDIVLPSKYLPQIWAEDLSFERDAQATEIIELLMRHSNTISTELQQTLHAPNVYLPVLLEREIGVAPANDWAHGFMHGVQMRPGNWGELIHDEDRSGPMIPFMMLHHERNPDPEMRPPPIPAEKRDKLLETMIAGLTHIHLYFRPHRQALTQIPDDADLPLKANGPAYTSMQHRDGVPLSYVGEKLRLAITDLHRHARHCQGKRDDLRCTMY